MSAGLEKMLDKTTTMTTAAGPDIDSDSSNDDRSTSFVAAGKSAPAAIRRRPPPRTALPRSSSFRNPKGGKRIIQRAVSFNGGGPELHRVESVRSLLNFDDAECGQLWYDEQELATTKMENNALVEQVESKDKKAKPMCTETETLRGLERSTEEGSMTAFMNRVNAIGAVMDHQEEAQKRQFNSSRNSVCSDASSLMTDDDEELATLASVATEDAKRLAIERALQDEKEAWEYLHGTDGDDVSIISKEEAPVQVEMEVQKPEEAVPVVKVAVPKKSALKVSSPVPGSEVLKKLNNTRPTPKRQGSLRIPSAFASTSDDATPSWGKSNSPKPKLKKQIGRSKSFTPKTASFSLLQAYDGKSDDELSDDDEEEDNLLAPAAPPPPSKASAAKTNLAPGRISRPFKKASVGCETTTPAVKKPKKPIGRAKSLDLESSATTMGLNLEHKKGGGLSKKADRLASLRAKAANQGDLAPDTS